MKVTFYRQKGTILRRRKGGWRWRLWSRSDIIAESGQAYVNLEDAQHGFERTINAGTFGYTEEVIDE
jgi:uncharacterized protein YegP (UPF0339 family)